MRPIMTILFVSLFGIPGSAAAQVPFVDVTLTANAQGDPNSIYSTNHAWADYDGDGDLDLYVTNWGTAADEASNQLLRNNGDGTFTDATAAAGFNPQFNHNNSVAAVWGDFNNDGDPDLYVVNFFEQDQLYRNSGGIFTEVTGLSGVDINPLGNNITAVWGDYDRDGDLDLYLCKYYAANELYANNGDGTFSSVTVAAGVGDIRDSEDATWIDFDSDGDDDLYVVNREQDNSLYENNGNGTFTEVATTLTVDDTHIGKAATWTDYNLDGFFDLYLANIGANTLYRSSSGVGFQEDGAGLGIRTTGTGWESWDAAWADYDADGDQDLLVVGGVDAGDASVALYFNVVGNYNDVTDNSGDIFRGPFYASSCSFVDFNNDGDLDIFMTVSGGENVLYDNPTSPWSYLKVRIEGNGTGFSNASGIGARIKVFRQGQSILLGHDQIRSGSGPLEAYFGLVPGPTYEVQVTFPNATGTTLSVTTTVPNTLVIQEP